MDRSKYLRNSISTLAFVAFAFSASAVSAQAIVPIASDPVTVDAGRLAGTQLPNGGRAYLGVPFAAPPINELRWHAPMPVKPWQGTYIAGGAKPACVQNIPASRALDITPPVEPVAEDCLYLNVWTPPATAGSGKLPVVVFIHGGGFGAESPNRADYSGLEISKKGVIYVSIGYRLGIFGYLAHPEMTKESGHNTSGNWGVLDQIAALQWVQRNIGALGGDPTNVTILGHSAGAESVYTLQSSPLAKGLFTKISAWSGSNIAPGGRPPRLLSEAEPDGMKLQEALKVANLAEMRLAPWDRIRTTTTATFVGPGQGLQTRPVIDGYVLPDLPETIFRQGKQNDVPMLLSSTNGDLGISQAFAEAKNLADFEKAGQAYFGASARDFMKLFAPKTDAEAVEQAQTIIIANQGFGLANRDWARTAVIASKYPVYLTQFRVARPYREGVQWVGAKPADRGAFHGSDIAFWLSSYKLGGALSNTLQWTPANLALAGQMTDALVAFAKTGNPNAPGGLTFPRYQAANEQRLILGERIYIENMDTPKIEFLRAHAPPR